MKLVVKVTAPDRFPALAVCGGWCAALYDELPDVPVERRPHVVIARCQSQEVLARPGRLLAEELNLDCPNGCITGWMGGRRVLSRRERVSCSRGTMKWDMLTWLVTLGRLWGEAGVCSAREQQGDKGQGTQE